MRLASWLLGLSLVLAGCSAAAPPSPSPAPIQGDASPSASPSPAHQASPSADAASPLEGRWATGPIPIAEIRASMVAAGIEPDEADAWIAEVGSPTSYSFLLEFTGSSYRHSEATPDMAMQVGESGSFALSGSELVVTAGEAGNVDSYTFEATINDDQLALECVDSTEQGTEESKAVHRRFTVAFYCSAPFVRQP